MMSRGLVVILLEGGKNKKPHKDLIANLISAPTDGNAISTQDFAKLRRRRMEQQEKYNHRLKYGAKEHHLVSIESALIQRIFGFRTRGYSILVTYAKAFFGEERLPVEEGWEKRVWWYLGTSVLCPQTPTVKKRIGQITFEASSH